tara:strand:- start:410 stop:754 length:345 start_codon:yes stop_codon:yes gene_type:complete
MKKNVFLVAIFIILNGCAQYTSFLGPSYTMAKSGSVLQAGTTLATSYVVRKKTGISPEGYINSLARKNYKINSFLNQKENVRECQTIHTSILNEIFFETLDEIDCYKDPFSILK